MPASEHRDSGTGINESTDASGAMVLATDTADRNSSVTQHRLLGPRHVDLPFLAAFLLVGAAALFQNLFRLSRAPLLFDEQLYAAMGWRYAQWNSLPLAGQSSRGNNFDHPPLAKLLFGVSESMLGQESITAARAVSVVCTLLAALILGLWLGRLVNRWVGLLAGGLLALIPMSVFPELTRFGRTAMLDPVAQLFMVCSVVLGWYWFRGSGRRSWLLALAAGVMAGLASASKESGFLGLVVPVMLGLVWAGPSLRSLLLRAGQVVAAGVAAGVAFYCCYLPFSDPIGRIRYLYDFQSEHSQRGHLVGLAGQVFIHPPWWANLWFAGQAVGPILTWTLPIAAVCAVVIRRDRLVAWLVAALVGPFVFHSFVAGVALPFYWALWAPIPVALAALGVAEVGALALRATSGRQRVVVGFTTAVAVVALLIPIVGQMREVQSLQPVSLSAVPQIRAQLGLKGTIITSGTYLPEISPFIPNTHISHKLPANLATVDTVLLGQPRCRTLIDPTIRAFVATNVRSGSLRLVRSDRLFRVYVASQPLHAPSRAEIDSEPKGRLADNC